MGTGRACPALVTFYILAGSVVLTFCSFLLHSQTAQPTRHPTRHPTQHPTFRSTIPPDDWVVMCGTNAGSHLKLANGISVGIQAVLGVGDVSLRVNEGFYPHETSDFAIAEIVVWDRGLTSDEMHQVSEHLMDSLQRPSKQSVSDWICSRQTLLIYCRLLAHSWSCRSVAVQVMDQQCPPSAPVDLDLTLEELDETSRRQKFKLSRVANSDGAFKIHSRLHINKVLGAVCDTKRVELYDDPKLIDDTGATYSYDDTNNHTWWKAGSGGSIESVGCVKMLLDMSEGSIVLNEEEEAYRREWQVMSNNVVLMEAGGNSTQTWSPVFASPGYDLALHPGFPGGGECLSSAKDHDLARGAMHSCDESMSLMIGSQASVGRLKAIADIIEGEGPERMPGYCCMDDATNSAFFGFDVSCPNCQGPLYCRILLLIHPAVSVSYFHASLTQSKMAWNVITRALGISDCRTRRVRMQVATGFARPVLH